MHTTWLFVFINVIKNILYSLDSNVDISISSMQFSCIFLFNTLQWSRLREFVQQRLAVCFRIPGDKCLSFFWFALELIPSSSWDGLGEEQLSHLAKCKPNSRRSRNKSESFAKKCGVNTSQELIQGKKKKCLCFSQLFNHPLLTLKHQRALGICIKITCCSEILQ